MRLPSGARRLALTFTVSAAAAATGLVAAAELTGDGNRADATKHARGTGSVVFLHPDGTGPNHFGAARMYWYGPDAASPWDQLPHAAVYRGHMLDSVTGTSNGGATTHAFGYKVEAAGSFGRDGDGDAARPVLGLSGHPGSIMREAASAGHPVGVVNDGNIGEPGTGAFLAEVNNRNDWNEIARQMIEGRSGGDPQPWVIMGGGERNLLPDDRAGVHCPAGRNTGTDLQRGRTDGRDLIAVAQERGYVVVRTRAEFETLRAEVNRRPGYAPRVLGVFACHHLFNDRNEEQLRSEGFVDTTVPAGDRRGDLVLFGQPAPADGDPEDVAARKRSGQNPPTTAEMTALALTILRRAERAERRHFMLVVEPESNDNFANANNAIGTLTALKHANDTIAVVRDHISRNPRTLLLTAADSDAGGMQVLPQRSGEPVGTIPVNPAEGQPAVQNPLDGIGGRGTTAFETSPDQFGQTRGFGVAWTGTPDVTGGIVARAQGVNAQELRTRYSARFDNVDVYRLMYRTLFGTQLAYPAGRIAPAR
ncbi:MAG TPA: alkaline phosphatase [Miltoncostaeaceae bacterium]|nr:alkaline phosphatase [Miltoncostaeaceae bacterium]